MVDYREILRLKSLNYPNTVISASVHSSRNTVQEVLSIAAALKIAWPLDDDVTNYTLESLLYPGRHQTDQERMLPDYPKIHRTKAPSRLLTMTVQYALSHRYIKSQSKRQRLRFSVKERNSMLLNEINPYIRQAITASLDINNKNDTNNELQAYDCRLFYILSNNGSMIIEGQTHILHSGCVILLPPGTKYTWKTSGKTVIKFITINFDYTMSHSHITKSFHPIRSEFFISSNVMEKITFHDATILNAPVVIDNFKFCEDQLRLILTEFQLIRNFRTELLSATLKAIIIHIVSLKSSVSSLACVKNYKLSESIINYIQLNYMKPLTNESISNEFHVNPVYMNRIFKQQTGDSVHAALLKYRLNIAMTALRTENISVQEIAYMVGFTDHIHFSKIFKKHIGVSPKHFRNSSN